jgi:dienelactone hydrolase
MLTTPAHTTLEALDMARGGRFAEIRDLFVGPLQPMVDPAALRAAWEAELERQGPVTSVGEPVSDPPHGGMVVVRVPVDCERGGLTLIASVAPTGALAGLQLAPPGAAAPLAPWEPPSYADAGSFTEHELSVGSGPLAVPGTLSLPRRPGPMPAAVLLAGSGSVDRDETIGRNKPFKDLAWGLAARGVATLRFDKVTFARRSELGDAETFTVADEYMPHAIAAVHYLRARPDVDAGRVFLLGHSLGGTVAPRIAAAESSIAGLVILAGGTRPMHWAAVRQLRYLASLDPATAAASAPLIQTISAQARLIDGPELSPSTPAHELPFGTPAAYWLDLRDYHPAQVAATLKVPMLILQGGRDYQVTTDDDLAGWEAALADQPRVTIRVYPSDNHLFFPGSGPPTATEYEPAQHVDPAVIADIAEWIAAIPGDTRPNTTS